MRCGHKRFRHTRRHVGYSDEPLFRYVKVDICNDCGAWLSLGPANDNDPRVAVELDAAHVAANWGDGAYWLTVEAMSATDGRNQEVIGLAREILEHDAEQGE